MKKVLFTSHLANFVKFNKPFMQWFQQQGWEVHYASLDEESIPFCSKHFKVNFNRSPFSFDNIKAYFQLMRIIKAEDYDIIHCHTPMGGVVTRIAALAARKNGTKVIYTAHGFHFYKGASRINWLMYYPIEKLLSFVTDCLITMNEEDYQTAMRHHFGSGRIEKINGVGVDLSRFHSVSAEEKLILRDEFGFGRDDFILLCVAELNKNKNQRFLLDNLTRLKSIEFMRLLIVGEGRLLSDYQALIEQSGACVTFLGYRRDVQKIYPLADVLVSSSYREGLPINVIEGMASGLPAICTNIRGHVDVVIPGRNGFLFPVDNIAAFSESVSLLFNDRRLYQTISANNLEDVQIYAQQQAVEKMAGIYRQYL